MITQLRLEVPAELFIKDPFSSELGAKIVEAAIQLINKIGYEDFTFKKLALSCKTTEATIYRYFHSKQQLLAYLCALYWSYTTLIIELEGEKLNSNSKKQLGSLLQILSNNVELKSLSNTLLIEELFRLVIKQWPKVNHLDGEQNTYLNDAVNAYKKVTQLFANVLHTIQPKLRYSLVYADTIVMAIHNYALNSCREKEFTIDKKSFSKEIQKFSEQLTQKIIA